MSFDLNEVRRLEIVGGATLAKYRRLVSECDQSMHGSLAHEALGQFQRDWIANPNRATEVAREEAAAAAAAGELAARAAG
jgi:hypothetical protein